MISYSQKYQWQINQYLNSIFSLQLEAKNFLKR